LLVRKSDETPFYFELYLEIKAEGGQIMHEWNQIHNLGLKELKTMPIGTRMRCAVCGRDNGQTKWINEALATAQTGRKVE
jgi:hypothetical protein